MGSRRSFVLAAVSTAVVGLVTLLSPVAALACSPKTEPVNEHCYGIAQWNVEGKSGSGFKGLDTILGINSEALYAYSQEGYSNDISDEAWLEFDEGAYWNESGEHLGCGYLIGCTPEASDRYFWFDNSETYGEEGKGSPEGGGPEEWEVADYYEPSTGVWYVKSKNWATLVAGQPSQATILTAGVETTTSDALNSAGASHLDWEDLQGKWHDNDWSSGTGHADSSCDAPAVAAWITKYTTFGYGVNIDYPCDTEDDALVSSPSGAGEPTTGTHTPPALRAVVSSAAAAMSPNLSATAPMSMAELKTRVTALAASSGEDPEISSIEVAQAPRRQAMAAVTPGSSFVETGERKEWLSESTYAVVLHGHFESAAAPSGVQSEGEPQPKPYTTLSFVLDARTGEVSAFALTEPSQHQPEISELGDVSAL